jgi:RNA polymerase sigma-70 factor, ECF subfamily
VDEGSDQDLAGRAAAGCRASFAALVARHYDRIHRLAWRWSGSQAVAEDVAQDVCIKLATAIRSFRGEAQFTTWAYRIAYTTTIDHLRADQRTKPLAPSEMMALIDGPANDSPEASLIGREVWQAVRGLPAQQRDAVLLVYGEDMNHAEAAVVMGCSEKTVSWHVFEAKKRLKVLLEAVG